MAGTNVTGGLQPYSVGEEYPLTVIGTIATADFAAQWGPVIEEGQTLYYVQNLVTGERDQFVYTSSKAAHLALRGMHKGDVTFFEYRPDLGQRVLLATWD